MKKIRTRILSACICLAFACQIATAQTPAAPLPAATAPVAPLPGLTGTAPLPAPAVAPGDTKPKEAVCPSVCKPAPAEPLGMILVYLPPVLFLFLLVALYRWAKREKLKLVDLLAERNLPDNHPATATGAAMMQRAKMKSMNAMHSMQPPAPAPAFAPTAADTSTAPATSPTSSSRLLLVLAGLAAVVISIIMTSYNMYSLQRYGIAPDWGSVTGILLSLGIGVTPYAVKQVFK